MLTAEERVVSEFLRDMKGSALHIVWAFLALKQPLPEAKLCELIDRVPATVSSSLERLARNGFAARIGTTDTWTLTDKGRQLLPAVHQLPLFDDDATFLAPATAIGCESVPATAIGDTQEGRPATAIGPDRRARETSYVSPKKNFFSGDSVVVVDQQASSSLDQQQQQRGVQGGDKKFFSREDDARAACAEFQIIDHATAPVRSNLVADAWVTGDRIRRAVQFARAEGGWDNPTGMAISRLRSHVEPPTWDEIRRQERVRLGERDIEAEWAEFVGRDRSALVVEAEWDEFVGRDRSALVVEDAGEPEQEEVEPPQEADSSRGQLLWRAALGELSIQMTKPTFDTWVKPAILVDHDPRSNMFTLAVETEMIKDWIMRRLLSSIVRSLTGITGRQANPTVVTWAEWAQRGAAGEEIEH